MNFRRPRVKNEKHLAFIRTLPCLVCGDNIHTEAAHIRMSAVDRGKRYTGKGEKPSDCWVVPLCSKHHREQHEGSEKKFWEERKIDAVSAAAFLYASSEDFEAGENIIGAHGNFSTPFSGIQ